MLVESASIFVGVVLLYIIPLGLQSVVAIAPMIILNMAQVISSFMIVYRVAQGTTKLDAHDDMSRIVELDIENARAASASRGGVSAIQYAIPSGALTPREEHSECDVVEEVDHEKGTSKPRDAESRSSEEIIEVPREKGGSDNRSGQPIP
jgi:hypothetical protein